MKCRLMVFDSNCSPSEIERAVGGTVLSGIFFFFFGNPRVYVSSN